MSAVRNILVGTDFSPASRPAFRRALEMASETGAALWIQHDFTANAKLKKAPAFYD